MEELASTGDLWTALCNDGEDDSEVGVVAWLIEDIDTMVRPFSSILEGEGRDVAGCEDAGVENAGGSCDANLLLCVAALLAPTGSRGWLTEPSG